MEGIAPSDAWPHLFPRLEAKLNQILPSQKATVLLANRVDHSQCLAALLFDSMLAKAALLSALVTPHLRKSAQMRRCRHAIESLVLMSTKSLLVSQSHLGHWAHQQLCSVQGLLQIKVTDVENGSPSKAPAVTKTTVEVPWKHPKSPATDLKIFVPSRPSSFGQPGPTSRRSPNVSGGS